MVDGDEGDDVVDDDDDDDLHDDDVDVVMVVVMMMMMMMSFKFVTRQFPWSACTVPMLLLRWVCFENLNSLSCQNLPNQSYHSEFHCSVPAKFKFTCKVDRIKCFVMLCYYVFCNNPIVFFCLLVTILL